MKIIDALSGVRRLFLDTDAAESAAEFRARYNLSLTDAFQIASALKADCDVFLTNDFGLQRVQELRVLVIDELEI